MTDLFQDIKIELKENVFTITCKTPLSEQELKDYFQKIINDKINFLKGAKND